jgi:hypothetical protein
VIRRVAYRNLNPRCAYCGAPSSALRVSVADDDQIYVASLCDADAHGERLHTLAQGFESMDPGGADLRLRTILAAD